MPPELTDPQRRARVAFCARRPATALATVEELEAAGLPARELVGLADAELVVLWDTPEAEYWTLTPLGAERLRLTLGERLRFLRTPEGEVIEEEPYWTDAPVNDDDGRLDPLAQEVRLPRRYRTCPLGKPVRDDDEPREPEPPSREPDPAAAAQAAECAELLRESEAIVKSEPDRARELLLRAESIVPGVADEMGERYLLEEGDRPLRIMGRLVPRDPRMGPSKAG